MRINWRRLVSLVADRVRRWWVGIFVREGEAKMMTLDQIMAMARSWWNQMFPGMPMMM
ncbi:hypothetical protein [Nocardia asiatica]|uniref:hypothetical protein n=1 Tax=Nocardia asiatica TaxID=209252 RepID=UPI0024549367|nr:hypothetical protein [Nocardia asiatica]